MLFGDLLPNVAAPASSHVVVIDALDECGAGLACKPPTFAG